MSGDTYTTTEGDMVDAIAYERLGTDDAATVRAIFEANPGLAALGPVLPAGVVVQLPRPVIKDRAELKRVWS